MSLKDFFVNEGGIIMTLKPSLAHFLGSINRFYVKLNIHNSLTTITFILNLNFVFGGKYCIQEITPLPTLFDFLELLSKSADYLDSCK